MTQRRLSGATEAADAIGYGAGITVFSLNLPMDRTPAAPGNGVHVALKWRNELRWTLFSEWLSQMAGLAMATLACGLNTTTTIMLLSCVIQTETRSKPSPFVAA